MASVLERLSARFETASNARKALEIRRRSALRDRTAMAASSAQATLAQLIEARAAALQARAATKLALASRALLSWQWTLSREARQR